MPVACGGPGGQKRDIIHACNATTKPPVLLCISLASYICHASMHILHEYQALAIKMAVQKGLNFCIIVAYNISIFHKKYHPQVHLYVTPT